MLSVVCLFPVESLPVKEPGKTSFWLVCWACLERPQRAFIMYTSGVMTSHLIRTGWHKKKTETENRNEALGAHNRRVRVPSSVNALRVYFF